MATPPSIHRVCKITGIPDEIGISLVGSRRGTHAEAASWIKLMLAASGEAMLMGAAAMNNIEEINLMSCDADTLEIIGACCGLAQLERAVVCSAVRQRPEALSTIAAFLAYTLHIGEGEAPDGFLYDISAWRGSTSKRPRRSSRRCR